MGTNSMTVTEKVKTRYLPISTKRDTEYAVHGLVTAIMMKEFSKEREADFIWIYYMNIHSSFSIKEYAEPVKDRSWLIVVIKISLAVKEK